MPSPTESTVSSPSTSSKPTVDEDELYRHTTQYRLWSFTEQTLLQKRNKVNQDGRAAVLSHIKRLTDKQPASSFTPLFNYSFEQASSLVEMVDPEEELKEVNYYIQVLNKLCKSVLKLPIQARYTAISFFKKFYLSNSVMQIHPKQVLTTCIFLACKSENCFISPNTLADLIGAKKRNSSNGSSSATASRESILSLEFPLLRSLEFSLMCHHPHLPLQGFLYDFQTVLILKNKQGVVVTRLDKHGNKRKVRVKYTKQRMLDCFSGAMNMVEKLIQCSDLMFLYTPSQIALACLYLVDEEITESYLIYKFVANSGDDDDDGNVKHGANEIVNAENDTPIQQVQTNEDDNQQNKETADLEKSKKQQIEQEKQETKKSKAEKLAKHKKLVKFLKKCIIDMQEKTHEIPDISAAKIIDKKVHYCIHPDKLLKRKMQDDELNNNKKVKIE